MVDDVDGFFAQDVTYRKVGLSSLTAENPSVIVKALARISEKVFTPRSDSDNLPKSLVDELEAFKATSTKPEKEIERRRRLVSEAGELKERSK